MIRSGERFRHHLDAQLVHLHKNLYISPSDPMYYDKVIRYVDANSPEAHYKLGQRFQDNGNRKRAIFHYKQVLKTYPSPYYSAANRAIREIEQAHSANMELAAAAGGQAGRPLLPPFMKTLLIVLFFLNLLLFALFFGGKAVGTTVSSLMKWEVGSSVTYETVDAPYVMYLAPETARDRIETELHKEALNLAGRLPDQNVMIYGIATADRGDVGKTMLLTDDQIIKSAFVVAEYHAGSDQSVKIRFLNPEYNKHQPLSAIGANFVRTALQGYRSDHGELPPAVDRLAQNYPDNYLSFIPVEPLSGSDAIHERYDGSGGWVYDPGAAELAGAFFANVPGGRDAPYEPLHIEISKSEHRLQLVSGLDVLLEREVGLGEDGSTPEGRFAVQERVLAPRGSKPGVYGSAGLGLGDIALHGTNDESSIGSDKSLGCVRMSNDDMQLIYGFVPKGAEVHIAAGPGTKANSSSKAGAEGNSSVGPRGTPPGDTILNPAELLPGKRPQLDETPEQVVFHWLG